MKYFVKIADREWTFHYSESDGTLSNHNDEPLHYDLQDLGNGCYSLILNGKSYLAHVNRSDARYEVLLENELIPVIIEDEQSLLLKQLTKHRAQESSEQLIKAPIPGLVTQVLVKQGDTVERDTTLLTLEAMKMENVIKAPCACVVEKVFVNSGDTVQQNQPLIELKEKE